MKKTPICIDCRVEFAYTHAGGPTRQRCDTCRDKRKRVTDAAKVARWRAADPERQRKYDREYQARRRLEPEFRQRRNEFEMVRKYGMTMDDFDAMLASQGGVCAICGGAHRGSGARFHVDHDHKTKKVRGLLCGKCNTAIGLLNDDPDRAERAAAYLRL